MDKGCAEKAKIPFQTSLNSSRGRCVDLISFAMQHDVLELNSEMIQSLFQFYFKVLVIK